MNLCLGMEMVKTVFMGHKVQKMVKNSQNHTVNSQEVHNVYEPNLPHISFEIFQNDGNNRTSNIHEHLERKHLKLSGYIAEHSVNTQQLSSLIILEDPANNNPTLSVLNIDTHKYYTSICICSYTCIYI